MRVIVAEKPSVARDIAKVLGAARKGDGFLEGPGVRVSWCVGHLVELDEPASYDPRWKKWDPAMLPMVPEAFRLRLREAARDQFGVLKRLLRDPETAEIVNACDAGREGELIFRWVAELAGCTKPMLRLWVSSLTDEAIRNGFLNLRPASSYDRLGDAARCRSEADWLVGLNATRALTCRARNAGASELFSVGRVQTPTLAMIVARRAEIEAFVPATFWQVEATFDAGRGTPSTFTANWFRHATDDPSGGDLAEPSAEEEGGTEPAHAERIADEPTAQAVARAVVDRVGTVEVAQRKRTRDRPPLLYDLTSLQRRANQRYGLSMQRTLEVAQALYEKHKLITYPRTDAKFLLPDQVPQLPGVVAGLAPIGPYAATCAALLAAPIAPGNRVVNAAEVGDHPAIIPTGKTPSSTLPTDEKRVFDLVARRFLAALCDDALFDVTRLVVAVDGDDALPAPITWPLRFRVRGRICRQEGWRSIDPPGRTVELELPPVDLGDQVATPSSRVIEGSTRAPRPFTDASLLKSMETAGKQLDDDALIRALRGRGLGTPATRASILQTLLDRGYVERRARELHATDRGRTLIGALPVPGLKSAELTAEWEGRLSEMADGRGPPRASFMRDVAAHVGDIVRAIAEAPQDEAGGFGDLPQTPSTEVVLGPCPVCQTPVRARGPNFGCDTGRSCAFVVFGTMSKRAISARMVKQLLAEGRTPAVKGFRSKAGKEFSAGLRWDPEVKKVQFWFPEGGDRRPPPVRVGDRCPTCGTGSILRGRAALGCSRWREGCPFRAPMP